MKINTKRTNTCSLAGESVDLPTSSSFSFFVRLFEKSSCAKHFSFFAFNKLPLFYRFFTNSGLGFLQLIKIPKGSSRFRKVYIYSFFDSLLASRVLAGLPRVHSVNVYGYHDKPAYMVSKKLASFFKAGKYCFVVGDFENFSDSIPKSVLRNLVLESDKFSFIQKRQLLYFINKSVFDGVNLCSSLKGVHTGTPVTNYLLNLFLLEFDNFLSSNSKYYMRVGDDFVCVLDKNVESQKLESLFGYVNDFSKTNDVCINFSHKNSEIEFLGYLYKSNIVSVRPKSMKKFIANFANKLQVVDACLETKIRLLKKIYFKKNGLLDLQKQFLLDYRLMTDPIQVKQISRETNRYLNRFLFGYMGFRNSRDLNCVLKTIGILSFEKLFYNSRANQKILKSRHSVVN